MIPEDTEGFDNYKPIILTKTGVSAVDLRGDVSRVSPHKTTAEADAEKRALPKKKKLGTAREERVRPRFGQRALNKLVSLVPRK
jgi:hypothetical protein